MESDTYDLAIYKHPSTHRNLLWQHSVTWQLSVCGQKLKNATYGLMLIGAQQVIQIC